MGESPFSLCFALEALIPTEIGSPTTRNNYFGPQQNDKLFIENLLPIEDFQNESAKKDEHFK